MRKVWKNKRVLLNCHIYQMLRKGAKKRHISFHTPGHKHGKWDITELSFSDNLSSPRGCIARAQADIARILGAHTAFIITDGSTAGVLSMLFTAKTLGVQRLAIGENSHKSVWNGCALFGISPILLPIRKKEGIPQPINGEDLRDLEADGVLITSPDYYGNIPDLRAIREYCDGRGIWLFIDGAHGGHLHFDDGLYSGKYADIWVDGVHKSLPALTQGAVVCARTEETASALAKGVDTFRTTSPSYPVMASVEYAVKYGENEWLKNAVNEWKKREKRLYANEDWTKVCALFGKNAFAVERELEKEGIYAEFCDGNVLTFYLSSATKKKDFLRLKKTLERAWEKYPYERIEGVPTPLFFQETGKTEWVELSAAAGRICAENCGLFPPCTPLILRGERVEEEKIALLQKADNVFGIKEDKISVFKTEEKE